MSRVRFAEFELDLSTGELRAPNVACRLPPQPLRVLELLTRRPGELVSREDIRHRLWSDETFVDFEQGLNTCIRQIRSALGDSAATPRFIETVPRRGYRFVAPVVPAASDRLMLAVLPLENLSGDPAQEFFSDGLTDELIAQLGRLDPHRLGVIARTSAMRYKHTDKGVDAIVHELGVGFVVEGSVRRSGGRVRVNVRLIQVSDQTQIWSDTFDRSAGDILALQTEVARAIAKRIGIALAPDPWPGASAAATIDPAAYESYLQGRHFWKQRSRQALEESVRCFQRAIARAPDFASAWAGLADVVLTQFDYNYLPPRAAFALIDHALIEALRLDNQLAEPHTSLGHLRLHQFDWSSAEQHFTRAVTINTGYDTAHYYYANLLAALGQFDSALVEAERAIELDPASANARQNRLFIKYMARRYDDALAEGLEALEREPSHGALHYNIGIVYDRLGRYDEALAAFDRASSPTLERATTVAAARACVHAHAGRHDTAADLLRQLEARAVNEYVSLYDLALVNIAIGRADEAIELLRGAHEQYSSFAPYLGVDARLDALRGDPRFQELITRLKLPTRASENDRG